MARTLIGRRIREQRRARGLTQAALAAQVGISPSYLNLIEADRRNIGGVLLQRVAQALGVALDEFDGAAERRLIDDLGEAALDPLLAGLAPPVAGAAELVARQPRWARALVELHRTTIQQRRELDALSDRLAHDPFLADAVHGLLTHLTAIRSASEILESEPLEAAQRERFIAMIAGDSRRMSDVAQALASFFAAAHASAVPVTPLEEVEDFVFEHDAHFPAVEAGAQALLAALGPEGLATEAALRAWLQSLGVQVRGETPGAPDAPAREDARVLRIPELESPAGRRFRLARAAAALACAEAIEGSLQRSPPWRSEAARERARRALVSHAAAALLMPYEAFHAAAADARCDVDRLALRFGVSFEQACQRLVTLRRPGLEGVRFGFMRCDTAGFVTRRLALPGFALPRYGASCPLWPVYQAFQQPGRTLRELVELPGGERYLMVARAVQKDPAPWGAPPRLLSVMLFCRALDAGRVAYGDGLDLSPAAPATAVGVSCRTCPRGACGWRQEDPILDAGMYRRRPDAAALDSR